MTYEEKRDMNARINAMPIAIDAAKRIGKRAFPAYNGRKFKVQVTDGGMSLHSYWDGGSRSYYQVIRLEDMASVGVPQNGTPFEPRGFNDSVERVAEQLPRPGYAVVEHSIVCGKDYGIRLYVHPDNVTKFLPAPGTEPPQAIEVGSSVSAALSASLTENHAKDGYELRFPSKPASSVLTALKANGWKWSSHNACWYIRRNQSALEFAQGLAA